MPNYFFRNSNIFNKKRSKKRKDPGTKRKKIISIFIIFFALIFVVGLFCIGKFFKINPPKNFNGLLKNKKEKETLSPQIKNFGIKIDKIGIIAPVITNVDGANKDIYNQELKKGVGHLKGSALPGEGSNIFIFGHSSTLFGSGPYSEIFAKLNQLENEDKITIFYKEKEFNYYVFGKEIIEKTDLSVIQPTKEEQLTLMTCWPIGTNQKRLIIKAKLLK